MIGVSDRFKLAIVVSVTFERLAVASELRAAGRELMDRRKIVVIKLYRLVMICSLRKVKLGIDFKINMKEGM